MSRTTGPCQYRREQIKVQTTQCWEKEIELDPRSAARRLLSRVNVRHGCIAVSNQLTENVGDREDAHIGCIRGARARLRIPSRSAGSFIAPIISRLPSAACPRCMSICSIGSAATWATRGAGPSGARLQSSRRSATRAVRRDTECCFVPLSSGPSSEPQIPPGAAIRVALGMQDLRARILRSVELQHHPLRIRNTGI
jgi:hypothetical protein